MKSPDWQRKRTGCLVFALGVLMMLLRALLSLEGIVRFPRWAVRAENFFCHVVTLDWTTEGSGMGCLALAIFAFWAGIPVCILGVVLMITLPRKTRPGYCRKCGYDLRGLSQPRCPECGKTFVDDSGAASDRRFVG